MLAVPWGRNIARLVQSRGPWRSGWAYLERGTNVAAGEAPTPDSGADRSTFTLRQLGAAATPQQSQLFDFATGVGHELEAGVILAHEEHRIRET